MDHPRSTAAGRLRVRSGGGRSDYDVIVERGALARLAELVRHRVRAARWVVLSDTTVASHYGQTALEALHVLDPDVRLFTFPPGERSKTRRTWQRLTDQLLECRYGRDTAIVALGGGVTGDLAGFVAATYMRGVPLVQAPTSLLAMIDASVGGKTGVDTEHGKNLVGAFHPPCVVVADPDTIRTLPRAERVEGLVEALKHGAILDADYFSGIRARRAALLDADPDELTLVVRRSVELKARVVGEDEREAGLREILNFGHTLGHAIEAASGYGVSHGRAVALGMVLEARVGEAMGVTEHGTSNDIREAVEALGAPSTVPANVDVDAILARLDSDKKRRAGRARFVLLERIGHVAAADGWSRTVSPTIVERLLSEAYG